MYIGTWKGGATLIWVTHFKCTTENKGRKLFEDIYVTVKIQTAVIPNIF